MGLYYPIDWGWDNPLLDILLDDRGFRTLLTQIGIWRVLDETWWLKIQKLGLNPNFRNENWGTSNKTCERWGIRVILQRPCRSNQSTITTWRITELSRLGTIAIACQKAHLLTEINHESGTLWSPGLLTQEMGAGWSSSAVLKGVSGVLGTYVRFLACWCTILYEY